MKTYNWQQADWADFHYDLSCVQDVLFAIAEKTGLIKGKLEHLTDDLKLEAQLNLMVEEAAKTSEIEGEFISRPDIRSSIKNKLKLTQDIPQIHDKRAQGVVDLMIDVRQTFNQTLTDKILFNWHGMLLSESAPKYLDTACWRTHEEPMQIISGRHGKIVVHYEAPPSSSVPHEMHKFISWFNATMPGKPCAIKHAPVRAAIAHLYFESVHPFEDGNGRIGRAIAEKAISQGLGYPVILSLSKAIESNKKAYYSALNVASMSNDITAWLVYFINVVLIAQIDVEKQINFILNKSIFFTTFEDRLNARQLKVIQRMMAAGVDGFEGGMSARKYIILTKTSKATATRDLQDLLAMGAVEQCGDGRSVRYILSGKLQS